MFNGIRIQMRKKEFTLFLVQKDVHSDISQLPFHANWKKCTHAKLGATMLGIPRCYAVASVVAMQLLWCW